MASSSVDSLFTASDLPSTSSLVSFYSTASVPHLPSVSADTLSHPASRLVWCGCLICRTANPLSTGINSSRGGRRTRMAADLYPFEVYTPDDDLGYCNNNSYLDGQQYMEKLMDPLTSSFFRLSMDDIAISQFRRNGCVADLKDNLKFRSDAVCRIYRRSLGKQADEKLSLPRICQKKDGAASFHEVAASSAAGYRDCMGASPRRARKAPSSSAGSSSGYGTGSSAPTKDDHMADNVSHDSIVITGVGGGQGGKGVGGGRRGSCQYSLLESLADLQSPSRVPSISSVSSIGSLGNRSSSETSSLLKPPDVQSSSSATPYVFQPPLSDGTRTRTAAAEHEKGGLGKNLRRKQRGEEVRVEEARPPRTPQIRTKPSETSVVVEGSAKPDHDPPAAKPHVRFARSVYGRAGPPPPTTHKRNKRKKNTKLGLPFIEVEDLVLKEALNMEKASVEAERMGRRRAHDKVIAEAEGGGGERVNGSGKDGEKQKELTNGKDKKPDGDDDHKHHHDHSESDDSDEEPELKIGSKIFDVAGGGFSGAATSIKTQQALKKLLRVRRAATTQSKMASSVGESRVPNPLTDDEEPVDIALPIHREIPFRWKGVDTLLDGITQEQMQRQLITVHRMVTNRDKMALAHLVKNSAELDLTLPLRGVTALSLSLYLRHGDMTRELLSHLSRLRQLNRAINLTSTDNAARRETPIVTAARMGLAECVALFIQLGINGALDVDAPDGQGRTALWHAVREEHFGIVVHLIERGGARVFYRNGEMSCPLQLACKTSLLKGKGRQMVRYLVSHGANVDYVDHALRNALYWSLYNSCGGTACFLLEAGTWPRPWSWMEDGALPTAVLVDADKLRYVRRARRAPPSLKIQARKCVRGWLVAFSDGQSIYPYIDRLRISSDLKTLLKLNDRATMAASGGIGHQSAAAVTPIARGRLANNDEGMNSRTAEVMKIAVKAKVERYKKQAAG